MTTLSLTGRNSFNKTSLSGNLYEQKQYVTADVTEFINTVNNLYITPHSSQNWELLRENMTFIEFVEYRLKTLLTVYSDNQTLQNLKLFLNILNDLYNKHIEIINLEQQITSENEMNRNMTIMNLRYKLPFIRLKPEYEIYNLIFDRQTDTNGNVHYTNYNETVINDISIQLTKEQYNFKNIKQNILNKYGSTILL